MRRRAYRVRMTEVLYTAVVLGSGQDGGVPQFGSGPVRGPDRTASSLAIVGTDGSAILVDASPDLRRQQISLSAQAEYASRRSPAPFDAVLLTHAHMGHYAGLLYFGKEADNSSAVPCVLSRSMHAFLGANEPWATLFADGHLEALIAEEGTPVDVGVGLRVAAHAVPHRPDFSDNLGFEITAPSGRSLLYLPDLDSWADWPEAADVLARVDVALIDATFYDTSEIPDRDIREIPHPLVTDTIERFASLAQGTQVVFTHLNWTNRLCDPADRAHEKLEEIGFSVAHDQLRLPL